MKINPKNLKIEKTYVFRLRFVENEKNKMKYKNEMIHFHKEATIETITGAIQTSLNTGS